MFSTSHPRLSEEFIFVALRITIRFILHFDGLFPTLQEKKKRTKTLQHCPRKSQHIPALQKPLRRPFRNSFSKPASPPCSFSSPTPVPLLAGDLVAWLWPSGAVTQILSIAFLYPSHGSASESPSPRNKPQHGFVSLSHFRVFKYPS